MKSKPKIAGAPRTIQFPKRRLAPHDIAEAARYLRLRTLAGIVFHPAIRRAVLAGLILSLMVKPIAFYLPIVLIPLVLASFTVLLWTQMLFHKPLVKALREKGYLGETPALLRELLYLGTVAFRNEGTKPLEPALRDEILHTIEIAAKWGRVNQDDFQPVIDQLREYLRN